MPINKPKKLTIEEVKEKYGDIELKFSGYWKYMFMWSAEVDDIVIEASIGGSSDRIYRFLVKPDDIKTINGFEEDFNFITIYKKLPNKDICFLFEWWSIE